MGLRQSLVVTEIEDIIDLCLWDFCVRLQEDRDEKGETFRVEAIMPREHYRERVHQLEDFALREMPRELQDRTLDGHLLKRLNCSLAGVWKLSEHLRRDGTSYGFSPWDSKAPETIKDTVKQNKRLWTRLECRLPGKKENYRQFLQPGVFERVLAYVGGDSCFQRIPYVCTPWFISYHQYLTKQHLFGTITSFIAKNNDYLQLCDFAITPQDLFTTDRHSRVDLVLYAKVLPPCEGRVVQLRHNIRYDRVVRTGPGNNEYDGVICPKKSTLLKHNDMTVKYEFLAKKSGTPRDIWMLSDRSRQHGDDVCVSECSFTTVCVDDVVEIPINFINEFAMAQAKSLIFDCPIVVTEREANIAYEPSWSETAQDIWRDLPSYKQLCLDRIDDWTLRFEPWLRGAGVHAIGIAQTCVRQKYIVTQTGKLDQAFDDFGQLINIFSPKQPIVITVPRVGLRHDRFQDLSLRVGDRLTVFRLMGGPIEY